MSGPWTTQHQARAFHFALPPSVGAKEAAERARAMAAYLTRSLGTACEAPVCSSYAELAQGVVAGRFDAAWAPPFVCARLENLGLKVLLRGVRNGFAVYRSALLARADSGLTVATLSGKKAVWTDRYSVAGHLLASAFLRAQGVDPDTALASQQFVGSFRNALEEVVARRADVTSIFAPPAEAGLRDKTGVEEIAPESRHELAVLAFTDEAPNDGVAVSASVAPEMVTLLTQAFMGASHDDARVLRDAFRVERFEAAPQMSYRALYKVALVGI